MTLDKLQKRITQLNQERDQLKANLIAYDGAIQDCNYWLSELDQVKEEEKENL